MTTHENDASPHGLLPDQIEALAKKAEERVPGAASSIRITRNAVQDLLPEGYTLDPVKKKGQLYSPASGSAGAGSSVLTSMRAYQPEFESPDRQFFPIHRRLANSYWRLFYKMDPVIGACIDLFCDLPWSDFQLTGEGVDGEIKETFEAMCDETGLRTVLPHLVREWLVVGEVIPHLFFDSDKGIWTHVTLHNPDQVNVVYSPFIKMDTIMEFVPDMKLRELVTSTHPMLSRVRETMPGELVTRLQTGQNIPLSPINASFIPRKMHWYDLRGTSILTRLWRTFMLEDSIWSATIQTARRAAAPVKIVKLGDAATNTIPGPAEERKILQLLAQAEVDPQAWIVWNHQIQFDLAGAPERIMSINQHYDLIERIKLVALGVSKSFVSGETSYSSAASGLTVFLQRLKAMRDFFVNEWLIPKFFLPVAVMNGWVKPEKAQSSGGQLRVKRSALDDIKRHRYIVPVIEWEKALDPTADMDRINAMQSLEQNLGIKISAQKKYAAMGFDPEEEWKQIIEETKVKKDLAGDDPMLQAAIGVAGGGEEGGGGGGMFSPGIPGDVMGLGGPPSEGGEGGPPMDMGAPPGEGGPPSEAPAPSPEGASAPSGTAREGDAGSKTKPPDKETQKGPQYWSAQVLRPMKDIFDGVPLNEVEGLDAEPWCYLLKDPELKRVQSEQNKEQIWSAVENWLVDENFPSSAIDELRDILTAQGIVKNSALSKDEELTQALGYLGVTSEDFVPKAAKSAQVNPLRIAQKTQKR